MFTVGLDVHSASTSLCLLDPAGNTLRQQNVTGGWVPLRAALHSLPTPFQLCFEASTGYGPLHDLLSPLAARTVVANPSKLRVIYAGSRKNDRLDAAKLARMLLLNQVPAVHVPPAPVRGWRSLIEHRTRIVHARVAVKNKIRALLRSFGILAPAFSSRKLWTKRGREYLQSLAWPSPLEALQLQSLLGTCDHLTATLNTVTSCLDKLAAHNPAVQLLQTIPGVGPRTAEAFVAYVDNPNRFTPRTIGAYFGLIPKEDSTGKATRFGHLTREGPATVRKLLAEAAWRGIQDSPTLHARFQRFCRNDKHRRKIALVALAHWLSRVMLSMLKTGQAFRESPQPVEPSPAATFLAPLNHSANNPATHSAIHAAPETQAPTLEKT